MLTFFEYLRQRAYESVLTGAQDALGVLESQKDRQELQAENISLTDQPTASAANQPSEPAHDQSLDEGVPSTSDDLLPPPRRRGRPPRGAKKKK